MARDRPVVVVDKRSRHGHASWYGRLTSSGCPENLKSETAIAEEAGHSTEPAHSEKGAGHQPVNNSLYSIVRVTRFT